MWLPVGIQVSTARVSSTSHGLPYREKNALKRGLNPSHRHKLYIQSQTLASLTVCVFPFYLACFRGAGKWRIKERRARPFSSRLKREPIAKANSDYFVSSPFFP